MISEVDRQKMFWLLKKFSSYTSWKSLADAYAEFSDAFSRAVEMSDDKDPDLLNWNMDWAKEVVDGKIAFEKGLTLLKKGDRQVFRNNSRGHLNRASDELIFIQKITGPDFVRDWIKNKDEVIEAEKKLVAAICGQGAATERDEDEPAALKRWSMLLIEPLPPKHPIDTSKDIVTPQYLSPAPLPTAITVNTGDEAPFDGIYEPEWSTADIGGSNWLEKLKSTAAFDKPQAIEKGCMNYLVSGAKAPLYQNGDLDKPMPVIWRLIWKDERYLDGTIPEEEAEYLKPIEEIAPLQLRCEANEPCPKTGYWWTPAKENSRTYFKQGDVMLNFSNSSYGVTIWQWDVNQF